jgi:hypothetical protein
MAQDQYGNFVGESDPAPAPYPPSSRCCGSGVGPPNDADGSNGQTYVDTSTGDLYVKSGDTWTIFSGGGGGATEVYFGTGDPNGVQTATRPAIFYDAIGSVWIKTSSGSSNTGWEQRL